VCSSPIPSRRACDDRVTFGMYRKGPRACNHARFGRGALPKRVAAASADLTVQLDRRASRRCRSSRVASSRPVPAVTTTAAHGQIARSDVPSGVRSRPVRAMTKSVSNQSCPAGSRSRVGRGLQTSTSASASETAYRPRATARMTSHAPWTPWVVSRATPQMPTGRNRASDGSRPKAVARRCRAAFCRDQTKGSVR
jgi:hypothetical protein